MAKKREDLSEGYIKIVEIMKRRRKELRFSREFVAQSIGCYIETIETFERLETRINSDYLIKLVNLYGWKFVLAELSI